MNVKQESVATNKIKLTIELSGEEFAEGMDSAYRKLVKSINIPGFRKGRAPRRIIENYYGESIFYEEAFNYCLPKAYDKAIADGDLHPVEQPDIDIVSIGGDTPTVFTAEFFVRPEVTLGEYKGIEVYKPSYPIGDEQIDAEIKRDQERTARWIDADRACQIGDRATIDYAGSVDGVPFEGGTSTGFPLELGSGSFIPGFEDQVVGMTAGEERDITVTFPTDYRAEELAGKEAVFHVALHQVQVKELSELDDEFAKDVSEFDTFEAYRASIADRLAKSAAEREDNEFSNNVVEAVAKLATVEIPAPMIETETDRLVRDMAMRFSYQGLRMEDFLQYTGQTMEQLRAQYKDAAEQRVRSELVLDAVRKAEAIVADEDEVNKLVEEYAAQTGSTAEKFTSTFTDEDWEYIRTDAATRKVIDFLKASIVPTDKAPAAPEAETETEAAEESK